MPRRLTKTWELYREAIRHRGQNGLPMHLRLFLFMLLFLNTIMLGVLLILFSTGAFKIGLLQHKPVLEGELAHIAQDIYRSFGSLSVQAVELSNGLSTELERHLKEHGESTASLQRTPELLEHLLDEELSRLVGALEKSKGSGAFLLLDATVNPALPDAEHSRACLYLKNMEPNIVSGMTANLRYSFGPMTIARKHKIHSLPQWQMEMDTAELSYFAEVMDTAREQDAPLSRLYRWSKATSLPGSSERVMLCIAPLVASDGTVFGVCGFEVSEMLFKLSHTPEATSYQHLFCSLSPMEEGTLQLSEALFSVNSFVPHYTEVEISSAAGSFHSYRQTGKEGYRGLHQIIALYPSNSVYGSEQWAAALLMPTGELDALLSAKSRNLVLGLLVLMLANIALASYISYRYIRPVAEALEQLKKSVPTTKTKIPEIDDLIEYLAAQDELSTTGEAPPPHILEYPAMYLEFVKNVKTLSVAEKTVFDLYVQGYTAKEIAEHLCLSINTIKTHNRRIYTKLNVTSRKELMVYIQMIEEADKKQILQ